MEFNVNDTAKKSDTEQDNEKQEKKYINEKKAKSDLSENFLIALSEQPKAIKHESNSVILDDRKIIVKTETTNENISGGEPEVVSNIFQFVKIEIDDEDSEFQSKKLSEVLKKSKGLKKVKEKNELCEFCNKSFAYKCDLIRHRRIHTGEKPFKCDECDNSFKYKRSLESHMVLFHTGKGKLHQCDICQKPFGMKQHMVKHRKIHFRKEKEPNVEIKFGFSPRGYLPSASRPF